MSADPSLLELGLMLAIMALAGLVHGTLGLGFPLIATPLLALFVDVRSAIALTLLPTVSVNLASILEGGEWRSSIGRFWPLATCALGGSVAGTVLLLTTDPAPFKLLLAALVLLYLGASRLDSLPVNWSGKHLLASMLGFGTLAGLSAGMTNVMVPILIIYTLEMGLARTAMVQVFNLCFLAGKVSQIAVFAAAGELGPGLLLATAPLALAALAALALGMSVRDRIPTGTFRQIMRGVLALLAAVLIGQYFAAR